MANLSTKELEVHVKNALSKLQTDISNLTEYQFKALLPFLNKRDTFVSLPTGYGKSLIYQIAIGVSREIEKEQEPVIVVVSPLNALIQDQIQSCSQMGISACKLDGESLKNFDQVSKSSILYTSPEVIEGVAGRKFIQTISERLVGIVIDESHCIVNWGLKSSSREVFRQSYGRVGNIRAFTKAPLLCLTATASVAVRKKILKLLHMKNVKIVKLSPEKANIKITIRKAEKDLDDTFKWLLEELNFQKDQTEKAIVYCQTISDCGELYSLFDEEITSDVKRFAMYHSKTPDDVQIHVLNEFMELDSQIRVVFATSALGMGVNVPDVRRIIHYGIPHDLEQYVQEIGRSGRDGEQSAAILLYCPYHLAHCDNDMRAFVKNDKRCRREIIAEYFKEKPLSIEVKHNCCDKCAESCNCMMQSCADTKTNSHSENTVKDKCCRTVEPCDYDLLKEILEELSDSYKSDVSILGMNSLSSLTDAVITDLLNNCQYIFTLDDVIEYTGILDERLVHEVLIVFNDVFDGDISEYELSKAVNLDLPEMEFDRYESVPDWCTFEGVNSDCEEQANSSDSD